MLSKLSLRILFAGALLIQHPAFGQNNSITPSATDPAETSDPVRDASEQAIISEREKVDLVDDSSVAEAVDRRPDLNFQNITIDGEKATVSLDEIPAESVTSSEVLRAVTPDLDADSRGGALRLESSPSFKLNKPLIQGSLALNYREEGDKWSQDIDLTYGKSLGHFGFRVTAKHSNDSWYNESARIDWRRLEIDQSEFFAPEYHRLEGRVGDGEESSISGSIDYKVSDVLSVFLRGNYEIEDKETTNPRLRYRFSSGSYTNIQNGNGISTAASVERDLLGFNSDDTDYSVQVGGIAKWDKTRIDFQTSYEDSSYVEPNWFVIQFEQSGLDLGYQFDGSPHPDIIVDQAAATNPERFAFDELLDEVWSDDQSDFISSANIKHDFSIGNTKAYIKTGLKFRSRERKQRANSKFYTHYNSSFTLADVVGEANYKAGMNSKYRFGPFPSVDESRQFFKDNFDNFAFDLRRTREKSDPNSFDVTEEVRAAYLMLNLEKGKMRGIIGARVEQTDLEYQANEVVIDGAGNYRETIVKSGDNRYKNWFPALHFRYFLGEKSTLIAAWTETIKRPDYRDTVPFRSINYEDQDIDEGNPKLRPTLYDNLDLSLDYKLNKGSTLSLELFYNEITDIVYREEVDIVTGEFTGFDLSSHKNGPSATKQGVKLIWNQKLKEWSSKLDGFAFNAKLTLTDSETEYPNRPNIILPITGTSEKNYQLTFNYNKNKTFVQLSYSKDSDTLSSVDDDIWRDRYNVARDYAELLASYKLTKQYRLFFEIKNLFNEPHRRYRGTPSRPSYFELAERQYNFGIRMKL